MIMVLVDASSLLYPAIFSSEEYTLTTEDGQEVTYIYTFLTDILSIHKTFGLTDYIVLFDSKLSFRKTSYPEYKAKRKEVSEDIKAKRRTLHAQIPLLKDFLTAIGIAWVEIDGLEADDLIASLVFNNKLSHFVTVSTDHDLWQTLGKNNSMLYFSKSRFLYEYDIQAKFDGMEASDYWKILSLSGCRTDDVPPIVKGVGEKTAYKYLTGQLKPDSKIFKEIELNIDKQKDNEQLVRLPHKNTPPLFVKDVIRQLNYNNFITKCTEYGFVSFINDADWKKFFKEV